MDMMEVIPNDITTIFEQLQTVQGLELIEYATKVEDAVKKMKSGRKLLEKQRIEMKFEKK